jgi:hypothetical protein
MQLEVFLAQGDFGSYAQVHGMKCAMVIPVNGLMMDDGYEFIAKVSLILWMVAKSCITKRMGAKPYK